MILHITLTQAVLYLKTYLRDAKQVESKTPLAFLYELHAKSGLERKALRFTYSRLNSLLRTLEVRSTVLQVEYVINLFLLYLSLFRLILLLVSSLCVLLPSH
jgi:hypothetical protein